VIEKLVQKLEKRPIKKVVDTKRTLSAVLIPCYIKNGEYHVLFIQRTDRVKDHKSQISFPGGACEDIDSCMADTALREAEEEIGLDRRDVRIIGQLDDMATAGTNYIISPIIGVFSYPRSFKVDHFETEEIIEVPISALMKDDCCEDGTALVDGRAIDSYFYHYGDKVIWGATARILRQFLEIISDLVSQGVSLEDI
jgi:8-oxo-dGTP pyrophosphatase MutT (NUDIX family)